MKTITTTREYDDEGRMVRETVVEYDSSLPTAPAAVCNCGYSNQPYTSGHYCQVHGWVNHWTWTSNAGGSAQTYRLYFNQGTLASSTAACVAPAA